MDRRIFIKHSLGSIALLQVGSLLPSCSGKEYYTREDFVKAPKVDAHFHYDIFDDVFVKYAGSVNMHLLTINVDAGEELDRQLAIGEALKKAHPRLIDFLGTISIDHFGSGTFAGEAVERVKKCMAAGARGIKIWKNIGMALRDAEGKYVMADHPAFAPVFAYLEAEGIPMAAHLGEPRNCWLPYDRISMGNDLNYYTHHPEYHMFQHPEAPSYEEQIAARDHLLERYPRLAFVGAHIGSLEWSLDEVAKRFDQYPNFNVDLSARLGHVQLQTLQDREKVRDFFIKYQDRILYGSDVELGEGDTRPVEKHCRDLYDYWQNHWLFLATGEILPADKFNTPNPPETIEGLRLPKTVVDKVFCGNFNRIFG
ncbi:MAG: amidohydrolase [Tannerella sp.]|jgi:predicted TIM-barrel fold metal-dependent hydrolase|nr:amidohydrolase [Tannerella sp.]